jgi:hypothetical protein
VYEALANVNGNVEDKAAFLKALETVNFTGPLGYKVYFDEKHGLVHDAIFSETRRIDDTCEYFEIGRGPSPDFYSLFP